MQQLITQAILLHGEPCPFDRIYEYVNEKWKEMKIKRRDGAPYSTDCRRAIQANLRQGTNHMPLFAKDPHQTAHWRLVYTLDTSLLNMAESATLEDTEEELSGVEKPKSANRTSGNPSRRQGDKTSRKPSQSETGATQSFPPAQIQSPSQSEPQLHPESDSSPPETMVQLVQTEHSQTQSQSQTHAQPQSQAQSGGYSIRSPLSQQNSTPNLNELSTIILSNNYQETQSITQEQESQNWSTAPSFPQNTEIEPSSDVHIPSSSASPSPSPPRSPHSHNQYSQPNQHATKTNIKREKSLTSSGSRKLNSSNGPYNGGSAGPRTRARERLRSTANSRQAGIAGRSVLTNSELTPIQTLISCAIESSNSERRVSVSQICDYAIKLFRSQGFTQESKITLEKLDLRTAIISCLNYVDIYAPIFMRDPSYYTYWKFTQQHPWNSVSIRDKQAKIQQLKNYITGLIPSQPLEQQPQQPSSPSPAEFSASTNWSSYAPTTSTGSSYPKTTVKVKLESDPATINSNSNNINFTNNNTSVNSANNLQAVSEKTLSPTRPKTTSNVQENSFQSQAPPTTTTTTSQNISATTSTISTITTPSITPPVSTATKSTTSINNHHVTSLTQTTNLSLHNPASLISSTTTTTATTSMSSTVPTSTTTTTTSQNISATTSTTTTSTPNTTTSVSYYPSETLQSFNSSTQGSNLATSVSITSLPTPIPTSLSTASVTTPIPTSIPTSIPSSIPSSLSTPISTSLPTSIPTSIPPLPAAMSTSIPSSASTVHNSNSTSSVTVPFNPSHTTPYHPVQTTYPQPHSSIGSYVSISTGSAHSPATAIGSSMITPSTSSTPVTTSSTTGSHSSPAALRTPLTPGISLGNRTTVPMPLLTSPQGVIPPQQQQQSVNLFVNSNQTPAISVSGITNLHTMTPSIPVPPRIPPVQMSPLTSIPNLHHHHHHHHHLLPLSTSLSRPGVVLGVTTPPNLAPGNSLPQDISARGRGVTSEH